MRYPRFSAILLMLLLPLLAACAGAGPRGNLAAPPAPGKDQALVSIYLAATGNCPIEASFTIDSLEVLAGDLWLPLVASPVAVELSAVRNRQQLLAVVALPEGDYRQIRLHLSHVRPQTPGGNLAQEGVVVTLPLSHELSLEPYDSKCLFVDWHLDGCPGGEGGFVPRFSAHGQESVAAGELLYIVCDDIATLYLVRTDNHFVTAAVGLVGRPGAIRFAGQRLYAIGTESRAINVLDGSHHRVLDRIPLPTLMQPRFLALSADGAFAFVTDAPTDRLVKVELSRGIVVAEAVVGVAPERLVYFENAGRKQLAISAPGSQQVLLVDAGTLQVSEILSVDLKPAGLLFEDGVLYVCDQDSNAVFAFNLRERREKRRIAVGFRPIDLIGNASGRIFVGNYGGATLSVVAPRQFVVQRQISAGATPFALALLQRRQILYAANRQTGTVTVLDLASEKILTRIAVGGTPFSLELQE